MPRTCTICERALPDPPPSPAIGTGPRHLPAPVCGECDARLPAVVGDLLRRVTELERRLAAINPSFSYSSFHPPA